jgi:hypothetical protein
MEKVLDDLIALGKEIPEPFRVEVFSNTCRVLTQKMKPKERRDYKEKRDLLWSKMTAYFTSQLNPFMCGWANVTTSNIDVDGEIEFSPNPEKQELACDNNSLLIPSLSRLDSSFQDSTAMI